MLAATRNCPAAATRYCPIPGMMADDRDLRPKGKVPRFDVAELVDAQPAQQLRSTFFDRLGERYRS
jgi:hypothetical protein